MSTWNEKQNSMGKKALNQNNINTHFLVETVLKNHLINTKRKKMNESSSNNKMECCPSPLQPFTSWKQWISNEERKKEEENTLMKLK